MQSQELPSIALQMHTPARTSQSNAPSLVCSRQEPAPYEPLPTGGTRVLVLAPGVFGTPLLASLDAVPVPSRRWGSTGYEAISYAWGSSDLPQKLHLQTGAIIPITESLYQALQHFRPRDRARRLWADAVCINQSDVPERSAQVAVMSEIFASATEVLVWLGPGDDWDPLAFAALHYQDPDRRREVPLHAWLSQLDDDLSANPSCACCHVVFRMPKRPALEACKAVSRLLDRGWFARLWILQEVYRRHNFTFYSGFHRGKWAHLRLLIDRMGTLKQDDELDHIWDTAIPRNVCQGVDFVAKPTRSKVCTPCRTIDGLVHAIALQKCADPRDRIFAMRRILSLEAIQPDYSLPTHEVYRRAVTEILNGPCNALGDRGPFAPVRQERREFGFTSVLFGLIGTECSAGTDTSLPSWPSWVPNFDKVTERSRAKLEQYRWPWPERADPRDLKLEAEVLEQPDEALLKVNGLLLARVEELLPESQFPQVEYSEWQLTGCGPQSLPDSLVDWWSRSVQFMVGALGFDALDAKQIRGVLYNINDNSSNVPQGRLADALLFTKDLNVIDSHVKADENYSLTAEAIEKGWQVFESIRTAKRGYRRDYDRILCTVHGRQPRLQEHERESDSKRYGKAALNLACVPPTTRADDMVCLVAGAMHPIVLRPYGDGTFRLLGDAWVRGIDSVCWMSETDSLLCNTRIGFRKGPCRQYRAQWHDWDYSDFDWVTLR